MKIVTIKSFHSDEERIWKFCTMGNGICKRIFNISLLVNEIKLRLKKNYEVY